MKTWVSYAGLTLVVGLVGVILASVAGTAETVRAVTFSAVLAWGLQAVAFAVLLRVRDRPGPFMVGWLGGIVMRFAAVGVVAYWVTRTGALQPTVTLLSLVACMFVMLMLEPVFLRKGRQTG